MLTEHVCERCGKTYLSRPDKPSRFCSKSCWAKSCTGATVTDLTGQRFGRWRVIERAENNKYGSARWCVVCDCGSSSTVDAKSLVNGRSSSCGCYMREATRKRTLKHGLSRVRSYRNFYGRQRRDREHGVDNDWCAFLDEALRGFQPACVVCGSREQLTVDHVVPVIRGGGLRPGNVVILCKSCNSSKTGKALDELSPEWKRRILQAAGEFDRACSILLV